MVSKKEERKSVTITYPEYIMINGWQYRWYPPLQKHVALKKEYWVDLQNINKKGSIMKKVIKIASLLLVSGVSTIAVILLKRYQEKSVEEKYDAEEVARIVENDFHVPFGQYDPLRCQACDDTDDENCFCSTYFVHTDTNKAYCRHHQFEYAKSKIDA